MRLVFVNHTHPQTPHISGVRLWRFAEELAKRGHQVVHVTSLLRSATGAPLDGDGVRTVGELAAAFAHHDWTRPLLISVAPTGRHLLDALRAGALPAVLRRAATAYALVVRGGVFYDWTDAAKRFMPALARFHPDVVIGTLGNTSNLDLARAIAAATKARLCIDVKDPPQNFVPYGTRTLTARRYRHADVVTTNSQELARDAHRWFGHAPRVVYSGVAEEFMSASPAPARGRAGCRRISLIGSVYSAGRLDDFLSGILALRDHLRDRCDVRLVYIGGDEQAVIAACARRDAASLLEHYPYVSLAKLAALCEGAHVNAYISATVGFHHKLLELLAIGVPVIAFGGESREAFELAEECECSFHAPRAGAELLEVLHTLLERDDAAATPRTSHAEKFSWTAQAASLEASLAGGGP